MVSADTTVLVSGASVAGLSQAFWLIRHGYRVTVVEQAAALPAGGYGVDFRGAQLEVLHRMEILDEVRAHATSVSEHVIVGADSEPLVRLPPAMFGGEVEIARGDLAQLLYRQIADDVELILDDHVTTVTQDESGVEVTFDKSGSRRFDLVVGADGLHSGIRRAVFGAEQQFSTFLGYYQASFTMPNDLGVDHQGLIYNEPGRAATVVSGKDSSVAVVDLVFLSEELSYDWRSPEEIIALVQPRFAGGGWLIPQMLRAMPHAADLRLSPFTQIHLHRWSRGRVVLLGDAAWSAGPGGSGTGLAMMGAYILAAELNHAGGEHQTAFRRYEQTLRKAATAGQKQAKGSGPFLAPSSTAKIRSRNRTMRLLSSRLLSPLFTRMTESAANAITLGNYHHRRGHRKRSAPDRIGPAQAEVAPDR